jgi:hypothetical protein
VIKKKKKYQNNSFLCENNDRILVSFLTVNIYNFINFLLPYLIRQNMESCWYFFPTTTFVCCYKIFCINVFLVNFESYNNKKAKFWGRFFCWLFYTQINAEKKIRNLMWKCLNVYMLPSGGQKLCCQLINCKFPAPLILQLPSDTW